jgi:hypothetical protein
MISIVKTLTFCRRAAARWVVVAVVSLLGPLMVAGPAAADDEEKTNDARLEGFSGDVKVENDSTALAWLFLILLGVIALSPLFKDAKRTHLD